MSTDLPKSAPVRGTLVLQAKAVSKRYRLGKLEVPALTEVSLGVAEGEFLALAGPSGSGKTTLLNLFGCVDSPTTGEIEVDGIKTQAMKEADLAELRSRKIGYVFQTFNLFPVLNAGENVEYPLLIQRIPARKRRELATEALAKVGLQEFAQHLPDQLSGGQRQRVAIARALVGRPAIILADEPTANLDRKTAREILELMQTLNNRDGATFVFSSHDPLVLNRAKRVFHLIDGRENKGETEAGHAP